MSKTFIHFSSGYGRSESKNLRILEEDIQGIVPYSPGVSWLLLKGGNRVLVNGDSSSISRDLTS